MQKQVIFRWNVLISITAISYENNNATLKANVYKNGSLTTTGFTLQWYKNSTTINNATSATLNVNDLNATYTCVVS